MAEALGLLPAPSAIQVATQEGHELERTVGKSQPQGGKRRWLCVGVEDLQNGYDKPRGFSKYLLCVQAQSLTSASGEAS